MTGDVIVTLVSQDATAKLTSTIVLANLAQTPQFVMTGSMTLPATAQKVTPEDFAK